MNLWRTILSAFCAAPTISYHRVIHEENRSRRENKTLASRVHRAAQTSALDIINDTQPPIDTLDQWVKGRDRE